jgi:hypothetical protein
MRSSVGRRGKRVKEDWDVDLAAGWLDMICGFVYYRYGWNGTVDRIVNRQVGGGAGVQQQYVLRCGARTATDS